MTKVDKHDLDGIEITAITEDGITEVYIGGELVITLLKKNISMFLSELTELIDKYEN